MADSRTSLLEILGLTVPKTWRLLNKFLRGKPAK
jgi:hypothetical protein